MMLPLVLSHRTPCRPDIGSDRETSDDADVRGRCCCRLHTAGYTLLELVIVLAIISVLAAVSMPALMRPWSKSHVQQAGQELSRILLKARLDSIQYGTAYQFRWCENSGQYEVARWQDVSHGNSQLFHHPSRDRDASSPVAAQSPGAAQSHSANQLHSATHGTARAESRLPANRTDDATVQPRNLSGTQDASQRISGQLANNVIFAPEQKPSFIARDPRSPRVDLADTRQQPTMRDEGRTQPGSLESPQQGIQHPRRWSEPIWFFPDGRTSSAELVLRAEDGYTVRLSLRGMTGTVRVGSVRKVELPSVPGDRELGRSELLSPNSTDGRAR